MIQRQLSDQLLRSLKRKEVTIIIGARQVGKTTMVQKVLGELSKKGEKVIFLNLDFEEDATYFSSQQSLLYKIQLEFGQEAGFVFIDEIQQKEDAGRFLKGIYDQGLPYKFVVTGSGSLELKEKISEALTGRKLLIEMPTVSFIEFIDYKTHYKYSERLELFCEIEEGKLELLLEEYLRFGGYPKVITEQGVTSKREVMDEIFTSYITKDISYLLGVRVPDKFVKMIKLLAVQAGGIINYSQLCNDTGLTLDTVKNYLWYAEQTFIIDLIKPYYTNAKKELTKSPTVYFNDTGMCYFGQGVYGQSRMQNSGFIFQNFVYTLLKQRFKKGVDKVNYWRTKDKAEVDFVVHQEGKVIPIEVKCSQLKKPAITRSYRSFINKYNPEIGYVVNLTLKEDLKIGETMVHFVPYWKLMFL